jgi:hypothetical protein
MLKVQVLHQPIHVLQVTDGTAVPPTYSDLICALAGVIVILAIAQRTDHARGIGDIAVGIRGDGGGWRGRGDRLIVY